MRIDNIDIRAFRIPLPEPMVSAKYLISHNELVLTRVTAEDGTDGVGWCTTVGMGATAVLALARGYLAPLVVGQNAWNTERIREMLWQDAHFLGPGGVSTLAIAGLDIALWDLKAKSIGRPLWQLMGGAKDRVKVYASAVNLHLSQDALLEQVEGQLEQGYDTFKLKIGRSDFEEDIARVRAVRSLIGPSRELLLDVNQRWSAGEAIRFCHRLKEACDPGWIEEPLSSDDVAGHVHLRQAGAIPVAVGEQLCNRFEFWNYVRDGAADILQPNPWKVGGITEWLKIAHMAAHASLPVAPHNSIELSAHLVAATDNGWLVENIFGGNLSDLGVASQDLDIRDGTIALGNAPGHGVVFDEQALASMTLKEDSIVERKSTAHGGELFG